MSADLRRPTHDPEHLKAWFAPRFYETIECDIGRRPVGIFRTAMRAPTAPSVLTRQAAVFWKFMSHTGWCGPRGSRPATGQCHWSKPDSSFSPQN